MSKRDRFIQLAQLLAPAVLAAVPHGERLAPLVPVITGAIVTAEQLHGATGPEKKALVLSLANAAATTLMATGRFSIQRDELNQTVSHGIDAVVGTINLIAEAGVPHPIAELPGPAGLPGILLPPQPGS